MERGIKHSSDVVRGMARLVSDYDPDSEDDGDGSGLIKSRVRLVKKKRKLYIRLAGRIVEGVRKDPVKQGNHQACQLRDSGNE